MLVDYAFAGIWTVLEIGGAFAFCDVDEVVLILFMNIIVFAINKITDWLAEIKFA